MENVVHMVGATSVASPIATGNAFTGDFVDNTEVVVDASSTTASSLRLERPTFASDTVVALDVNMQVVREEAKEVGCAQSTAVVGCANYQNARNRPRQVVFVLRTEVGDGALWMVAQSLRTAGACAARIKSLHCRISRDIILMVNLN
mmetsp:Transcript_10553/g.18678  ORF Transcript_10553/g.18678 Transcript_10553/m.18678 type:complete len:147 (+) Transcript_10553:1961-2401(+)